jgi:hypothetical protein
MSDQRIEVQVGKWARNGMFLGHIVRFTGEEIGAYIDYSRASGLDDRGTTHVLYRVVDSVQGDWYRVYVKKWSRWPGEGSEAYLSPTVHPDDTGDDEEKPVYDTFTEESARRLFPELFAAAGMPNVRELA